ncbi:hypothetical protein [Thermococcus sp. Bubb.Bath]|uniref:hypothetical protein n=1 Tax=Thermococcus sp. Bubb.Bath TaxID=1638242 RepID=UPI00143BD04A|nr:hypothetical protein [Thermococcus sp. Bubb.Bath]NJF25539.1 hypothetical protein [Thermococcus sp. Bubb.Bath]
MRRRGGRTSSLRAKRAQTALEVLFIAAVIVAGAALIVPPYLDQNTDAMVVAQVRSVADDACAYLNTGVVIQDSKHAALNPLITNANYSSIGCMVRGVGITSSNDTSVTVKVELEYIRSTVQNSTVANATKSFIINELKSRSEFHSVGSSLVYGKKSVSIIVQAVRR